LSIYRRLLQQPPHIRKNGTGGAPDATALSSAE
jgi:hypothetical protein